MHDILCSTKSIEHNRTPDTLLYVCLCSWWHIRRPWRAHEALFVGWRVRSSSSSLLRQFFELGSHSCSACSLFLCVFKGSAFRVQYSLEQFINDLETWFLGLRSYTTRLLIIKFHLTVPFLSSSSSQYPTTINVSTAWLAWWGLFLKKQWSSPATLRYYFAFSTLPSRLVSQ